MMMCACVHVRYGCIIMPWSTGTGSLSTHAIGRVE